MNKEVNDSGYILLDSKLLHRTVYFCSYPKEDRTKDIHHIDCDKRNNAITNLIALSKHHHKLVHERINKMGRFLTREEIVNLVNRDVRNKVTVLKSSGYYYYLNKNKPKKRSRKNEEL